MTEPTKYFVVTKKAVPEVLLKVVEAKRLLESGKLPTIQDAVDAVGISRSSFYKYKDDIFPFHDSTQGKTVTLSMQIEDEPGLLSDVLQVIAQFGANIPVSYTHLAGHDHQLRDDHTVGHAQQLCRIGTAVRDLGVLHLFIERKF